MLSTKFRVTGLSVQEKKHKIDFQDSSHNGHFGFLIRTILALFYLQVTLMLTSKFFFESTGLSVQEKKQKKDFQDGGHLGFLIGTILAVFYLQVTPMLPTKFQLAFCSGEEKKIFKMAAMGAILDFRSEWFWQFLLYTLMLPTKSVTIFDFQ